MLTVFKLRHLSRCQTAPYVTDPEPSLEKKNLFTSEQISKWFSLPRYHNILALPFVENIWYKIKDSMPTCTLYRKLVCCEFTPRAADMLSGILRVSQSSSRSLLFAGGVFTKTSGTVKIKCEFYRYNFTFGSTSFAGLVPELNRQTRPWEWGKVQDISSNHPPPQGGLWALKILIISPGLIQLRKRFWGGEELITGL